MPSQDAPWGNISRQSVKPAESAPLITTGFGRFLIIVGARAGADALILHQEQAPICIVKIAARFPLMADNKMHAFSQPRQRFTPFAISWII